MSQDDYYQLKPDQREQFAGIYLLDHMVSTPTSFPIILEGNDEDLEPVLEWLLTHEYVEILDQSAYVPSTKGKQLLEKFKQRYRDYLTNFDIYSAVDLESGTFAFAKYHDFDSETDWREYLDQDCWDDLRVGVADYQDIDPIEIVFMSFLNEGKFGRDENGWQFDLLLGSVWDEILEICNEAIDEEDLGWSDEQGEVSGETVMEDIIAQGSALIEKLHLKEEHETENDSNPWI